MVRRIWQNLKEIQDLSCGNNLLIRMYFYISDILDEKQNEYEPERGLALITKGLEHEKSNIETEILWLQLSNI